MSRSRKKNPISKVGSDSPGTHKAWKSRCNRKLRRLSDEEIPLGNTYRRLSGDLWLSPTDGKFRFDENEVKYYRK